jgi:flagellar export protein FliJ
MPKFKFRLATLLKIRESTRDERRSLLAQAYQAEELIQQEQARVGEELADLARELRAASGPGPIDVDRLLDAQRFELTLKGQQAQLALQLKHVRDETERRRQALVESNREVQVLENLREKQRERWRDEENVRDIKRLDEVAQKRLVEEERE